MNHPTDHPVVEDIKKAVDLAKSHGPLRPGKGMVSGIIALALADFSILGVLILHFPAYLTTPEVRAYVSFDTFRAILFCAMVLSGAIVITNFALGRVRRLSRWALFWLTLAAIGGGAWVPVGELPLNTPHLGLDWFILDLLATSLVFIAIEKARPLNKNMPVFRDDWQTDFTYFVVGHLAVGLILLLVSLIVRHLLGWMAIGPLQQWVQSLSFWPSLLLLMLVTDFYRYWLHRAYHEIPWGWRLHAVHHSTEHMDWLSGSRTHVIETVISSAVIIAPSVLMGFPQAVINVYILIAGFQAVFNHANVSVRLGPLRYLIVTPNFHHWHHSQDEEALDRCYAAHFAFWDYLFGTAVPANEAKKWPHRYGVVGDYVPRGFWKQQLFPFNWNGKEQRGG